MNRSGRKLSATSSITGHRRRLPIRASASCRAPTSVRRPSSWPCGGGRRPGRFSRSARTRSCRRHGIAPACSRTGPSAIRFEIDFRGQTGMFVRRTESMERFQGIEFREHENLVNYSTSRVSWMDFAINVADRRAAELLSGGGAAAVPGQLPRRSSRRPRSARRPACCSTRPTSTATSPPGRRPGCSATIFDNHIVRSRVNYQFTRELSFRAILDYNGVLANPSLVALRSHQAPHRRPAADVSGAPGHGALRRLHRRLRQRGDRSAGRPRLHPATRRRPPGGSSSSRPAICSDSEPPPLVAAILQCVREEAWMSEAKPRGRFVWFDLMTTDPAKAVEFYTSVAGWGTTQWEGPAPVHDVDQRQRADRRGDAAAARKRARRRTGSPTSRRRTSTRPCSRRSRSARKTLVAPNDMPTVGRFAVLSAIRRARCSRSSRRSRRRRGTRAARRSASSRGTSSRPASSPRRSVSTRRCSAGRRRRRWTWGRSGSTRCSAATASSSAACSTSRPQMPGPPAWTALHPGGRHQPRASRPTKAGGGQVHQRSDGSARRRLDLPGPRSAGRDVRGAREGRRRSCQLRTSSGDQLVLLKPEAGSWQLSTHHSHLSNPAHTGS